MQRPNTYEYRGSFFAPPVVLVSTAAAAATNFISNFLSNSSCTKLSFGFPPSSRFSGTKPTPAQ